MNIRLFVLALASLALFAAPITKIPVKKQKASVVQVYDCKYGQCEATAKSTGQRCKHCVSNAGDRYCWQHKD